MKMLLLFVATAVALGVRSAPLRGRPPRDTPTWQIFALSLIVGASYLSLSVVWG
jgi:hypothetical protein